MSYPEPAVTISRRSRLVALAAAALAAVLIVLSLGGGVGHSTSSLPQVRDMAPAWNRSHVTPTWDRIAPVGPVSVTIAPSTHSAGVVRARP